MVQYHILHIQQMAVVAATVPGRRTMGNGNINGLRHQAQQTLQLFMVHLMFRMVMERQQAILLLL